MGIGRFSHCSYRDPYISINCRSTTDRRSRYDPRGVIGLFGPALGSAGFRMDYCTVGRLDRRLLEHTA